MELLNFLLVSTVEGPLYTLLCPEMRNTEMDLLIWRVLLGLLALEKEATGRDF